MDWNADGEIDNSELRLTGLILAQSALIGVAVGVFDSGIWLPSGESQDSWVNGMTYSMAALAVQIVAFYLFKMFFEQSMRQRVSMQNRQKEYEMRIRGMQGDHEQRRMELQLRVQEMQLERDLAAFKQNPTGYFQQPTSPPELQQHSTPSGAMSLGLDTLAQQPQSVVPPRNLDEIYQLADSLQNMPTPPPDGKPTTKLKKDGTPDLRYKS